MAGWVNWLFMLALAGVGTALIAGIGSAARHDRTKFHQNEGVRVEAAPAVPQHPAGEEQQRPDHEPPRTHQRTQSIGRPFAEVVRHGLAELLRAEGDIEVVGESGSAREAAACIPALKGGRGDPRLPAARRLRDRRVASTEAATLATTATQRAAGLAEFAPGSRGPADGQNG